MNAEGRSLVRKIFGNLAWLLSGKAAAGIISLSYLLIATRALGPHDYGLLVILHAYVLTISSVVSLQVWPGIVRFGFRALHEGRHAEVVRLMRYTTVVEIAAGVLGFVVAVTGALVFGETLGWSDETILLAVPYSIAVLASTRATPAGLLQLVSRFDLLGWHQAIQPGIRMIGAIIAWVMDTGLVGFLIAWLVAELVECAAMWAFGLWVARRELPGVPLWGAITDARREHAGLGRYILVSHGDSAMTSLAPRVVPLLVGSALGPEATGLFSIAQRAAVVIAEVGQLLGRAAFTEFARLFTVAPSDAALHPTLWRTVAIAAGAIVPVIALIGFFADDIARFMGGAAFAAAAPLMIWLALARTVQVASSMAATALVAAGRPGLSIAGNIASMALALPLLPWLLQRFGVFAAGAHALGMAILTATILVGLLMVSTRRPPPDGA